MQRRQRTTIKKTFVHSPSPRLVWIQTTMESQQCWVHAHFVLMIVVVHSSCTQLKKENDKSKHNSSFSKYNGVFSSSLLNSSSLLLLRLLCFCFRCPCAFRTLLRSEFILFIIFLLFRMSIQHHVSFSLVLSLSLAGAHTFSGTPIPCSVPQTDIMACEQHVTLVRMSRAHTATHTHTNLLRAQSQRTHNVVIVVMLKFCVYKNTLLLV